MLLPKRLSTNPLTVLLPPIRFIAVPMRADPSTTKKLAPDPPPHPAVEVPSNVTASVILGSPFCRWNDGIPLNAPLKAIASAPGLPLALEIASLSEPQLLQSCEVVT